MRRRLVLWGTNAQDDKVLLGLELLDHQNKVKIYVVPENEATEAFYVQMMNLWRDGNDVLFPEHTQELERDLSVSEDILPEDLKVERTDLVLRAKAEWHFVVLSSKLYEIYKSEIEDLKETVENLKEYDDKIWEELKGFWEKVQSQMKEKNIFREHAESLKNKTNQAFDHMKELRKEVEKKFREESKSRAQDFKKELEEIEEKIEKGLGLKPIFEELKDIQQRFKKETFARKDQNNLWKQIDSLFKVVKEKRFGEKTKGGNSPLDRIKRRYDGLLAAIGKMQRSIDRDKHEIDFQNKRINSTNGQLEMQIRQAKLKMIEERIKSKTVKLEDMLKTKVDLEAKIATEEKREEKRQHQEELKKKKEEIKEKIAAEMANTVSEIDDKTAVKLEKAAEEIKEQKKEKLAPKSAKIEHKEPPLTGGKIPTVEEIDETVVETKVPETKDQEESIQDQAEAIISDIGETISESVEDIMTSVKAVAEVVGDKVEDFMQDLKKEEEE